MARLLGFSIGAFRLNSLEDRLNLSDGFEVSGFIAWAVYSSSSSLMHISSALEERALFFYRSRSFPTLALSSIAFSFLEISARSYSFSIWH